ncbi:MAG: DUF169 domain-containing protein [Pseudomonadota bacterium]
MALMESDYDILNNFGFAVKPVGIKYFVRRPQGIGRLEKRMALCEMLREAQEGEVFCADADNHTCEAGPYVLGHTDAEQCFISGEYGAGLQVFSEERAAGRLYHYVPRIAKGVANFVAFSCLDKLSFDPDVLIIVADISQTEILLRAMSYRNGKMWSSRYSAAIGCSWLFVYPYLSGEMNYVATGLGSGMKRRKVFPDGLHVVSIPFDRLPSMLQVLKEMPWVPKPFGPDGPEYVRQLRERLGLE